MGGVFRGGWLLGIAGGVDFAGALAVKLEIDAGGADVLMPAAAVVGLEDKEVGAVGFEVFLLSLKFLEKLTLNQGSEFFQFI